MKFRIPIGQRVKSGMIAKGAFPCQVFCRINIPLNDNISIGRNFNINGNALYQLHSLLSDKSRQQVFIYIIG